jgi:hypothetical protein
MVNSASFAGENRGWTEENDLLGCEASVHIWMCQAVAPSWHLSCSDATPCWAHWALLQEKHRPQPSQYTQQPMVTSLLLRGALSPLCSAGEGGREEKGTGMPPGDIPSLLSKDLSLQEG